MYASFCDFVSLALLLASPRVLAVRFCFSIVFSACYHWWICFLVWLLSSFFLFNKFFIFYFNNTILFYFSILSSFFSPFSSEPCG